MYYCKIIYYWYTKYLSFFVHVEYCMRNYKLIYLWRTFNIRRILFGWKRMHHLQKLFAMLTQKLITIFHSRFHNNYWIFINTAMVRSVVTAPRDKTQQYKSRQVQFINVDYVITVALFSVRVKYSVTNVKRCLLNEKVDK